MHALSPSLQKSGLFKNDRQAAIYLALLRHGPSGAEKIHQSTRLHRETVQRELKKMAALGTVQLIRQGRNKKAKATPIAGLQEMIEEQRLNFDLLLKPLLEAQASGQDRKIVQIFKGNHAFGLLQLKLIRLQPEKTIVHVISTRPKEWVEAMNESRKLRMFEQTRLRKSILLELSCFSELRGQVERNARDYFADQPPALKRRYKYIDTEVSSPMQIQIWTHCIVISVFDATPSLHIVIEDLDVVKAMSAYFKILWSLPNTA